MDTLAFLPPTVKEQNSVCLMGYNFLRSSVVLSGGFSSVAGSEPTNST